MTIRSVAVIGAGAMGSGIAQLFAVREFEVRLVDVAPGLLEEALASIGTHLGRQVDKDLLTPAERDAALRRIRPITGLEEGVAGVDFVVEAVPEDPELKDWIFGELDQASPPDTILASNTSSISITALAGRTSRPDRVVGMHFMNPAPVMELVEVIRGLATADETARRVTELARALGKTPVEVNDFPGFVSNRILMPMINEAIFALMEGVAEAEAIDTVMRLGMRHPMGPLALADLIGLDICLRVLEVLQRDLGEDRYRPCPLLRKYVAAGRLGRKSGQGFYRYDT